jgi:hypothetical protein
MRGGGGGKEWIIENKKWNMKFGRIRSLHLNIGNVMVTLMVTEWLLIVAPYVDVA